MNDDFGNHRWVWRRWGNARRRRMWHARIWTTGWLSLLFCFTAATGPCAETESTKDPGWYTALQKLDEVRLPSVTFTNVPILAGLKAISEELFSVAGIGVGGFVEGEPSRGVSLDVRGESAYEAIRRMADNGGLKARAGEFGFVFTAASPSEDLMFGQFLVNAEFAHACQNLRRRFFALGPDQQAVFEPASRILLLRDRSLCYRAVKNFLLDMGCVERVVREAACGPNEEVVFGQSSEAISKP